MKKLLVFLKDYKKESILGPLFKLLEASFELFVPLVIAAIIDTGVTIGKGAVIGEDKATAKGIAVIGEDVTVEDGARVEAGAMIPEV